MKSFEESIAPIIQGAKDQGFMAGQQSKQAEVDELRKRIDVLTGKVNEMAHIFLDDLEEILKGENHES